MADTLIKLFQKRTVLISTTNSIGTGTLIAPGKVLTCAHVIRKSIDDINTIKILFPDVTQPGHFEWEENAAKVYLSKIYEESNKKGNEVGTEIESLKKEYPDVAIIEIAKKDHALMALPNSDDISSDLQNRQFLAFGFQKKDRDLKRNVPQAVSLNYNGEEIDSDVIRKLVFANGLIRPGMSGAALIERETGDIIGIVQMTRSANDDLGAYVIPIDIIWKVFKKWEEDGDTEIFSELHSKEVKKQIQKEYNQEYPKYPMYRKYGIRLIILPTLIFLLIWWMFYHLGQIQESGLVAIILVTVTISGKIMGDWLGEAINTESSKLKNTIGSLLFGNVFLIGLGIITLFLWVFTTSIWVHGNSEFDQVPITLFSGEEYKEGRQKSLNPIGDTRFLIWTTFMGDSVKIVPEGMEELPLFVSPFSKKELYYPKSFLKEPLFLIRFDARLSSKMNKYRVEVQIEKQNGSSMKFTDSTLANSGAILLGKRKLKITKQREQIWKDFFVEGGIRDNILEKWTDHWKKIKIYNEVDLDKNDRISIKVIKKSDSTIINEQSYKIGPKTDNIDKLLKFKF
ncbi:trypsin-like peptidase domain-containing protein [uncultured Aquimarina sp.]|uniref:trypsin-like peptidase domain-containing protein n=1 Tax=uncultured Aquimarina sp. TaxID=575652 RepID=UPI0026227DF6|nr:trypsin-like peptidase domain-containing protein [uncultured Aquimarina sp.]